MEKIDIVITWVDGSDQDWIQRRNQFSENTFIESQFRDWDNFKYVFRSIEKFAPWVNHVFLVTEGHIPNFINKEYESLTVVRHEDFIPAEYLPVFSSHPIELNLHRIDGLSENFIYLNDDTFFINKTVANDFFRDNLPCDTAIINPIAPSYYNSIAGIMVNNIAVINQSYSKRRIIRSNPLKWFNYRYGMLNLLNLMSLPWGKFTGLYQGHLASSFKKETFKKAWENYHDILNATCNNKFRNNFTDVNQWLMKEIQIAESKFSPRSPKFGKYIMIKGSDDALKANKLMETKKYKMICLNDHVDASTFKESSDILLTSLDKKFPNKSKFEK